MSPTETSERELKITAALYASRSWIVEHVRATGKLPDTIELPGGDIGMRLLIKKRGTDITLTPDEQLVYDAMLREKRLPGPSAILVDEAKKRIAERRRSKPSKSQVAKRSSKKKHAK